MAIGLHIRNYREANRLTAKAGEVIPVGSIVKVVNDSGLRKAMKLTNADAASLVEGNFGLAFKVSDEPLEVTSSTAPAKTGLRVDSIASGDYIVVATNCFVEFAPSFLDDTLNPAEGGTLPTVGDKLEILDGKLCEAGTATAITTPIIARVYEVVGGLVTVHITETPLN